jgi:hypothetical protein
MASCVLDHILWPNNIYDSVLSELEKKLELDELPLHS